MFGKTEISSAKKQLIKG